MRDSVEQWSAKYRARQVSLQAMDRAALTWLAQLRLMTTTQLHALIAPHAAARSVRYSLARLATLGLVESVRRIPGSRAPGGRGGDPGRVWFLTGAGHDVAEPAMPRIYRVTPERAGNDKQAHALAVTDVAAAFVQWLSAAGHEITPSDCEAEFAHQMSDRTAQRFANLQITDLRIRMMLTDPDGDIAVTRLIEVDRGTESVPLLVDKVRNYARVLAYHPQKERDKPDAGVPGWRYFYPKFPKLIFVFADPGATAARTARRQEQLLQLLVEEKLLARPLRELGLSCTTLDQLQQHGPLAPIFTTLTDQYPVDLLGRAAPRPAARGDVPESVLAGP